MRIQSTYGQLKVGDNIWHDGQLLPVVGIESMAHVVDLVLEVNHSTHEIALDRRFYFNPVLIERPDDETNEVWTERTTQ